MEVVVAKGMNWLGHKEGTKLNVNDNYAADLIRRGVVERAKMLVRSDHDKQVKASSDRK